MPVASLGTATVSVFTPSTSGRSATLVPAGKCDTIHVGHRYFIQRFIGIKVNPGI